jgi:RNA polymerase sigma-70 factor (ECF subfamily)
VIDATLAAARPRAVAALLRYFRDLDAAEDAFQEAAARALERWPRTGPPRDAVAWLVLVGRNAGVDASRRASRLEALPDRELRVEDADVETEVAERIEAAHYGDDVLRLLFTCCHPALAPQQQLALALRVVSGLSVAEIARAFLVSEAAMEQRITRAKRSVAQRPIPFEAPSLAERAQRLGVVMAALYALFNEGYSASAGDAPVRAPLCEEAIRLARILLQLFPSEGEVRGLTALFVLQHSRAGARLAPNGELVTLDRQDRARWDAGLIGEGLALLEKGPLLGGEPGPYELQARIAAEHARARDAAATDWAAIDALYARLEQLQPSPVVTLNRAVATAKVSGPAAALALIEPLASELARYFHYHGARGALLRELGRAAEARAAWTRALALAPTLQEAAYIREQLDTLAP